MILICCEGGFGWVEMERGDGGDCACEVWTLGLGWVWRIAWRSGLKRQRRNGIGMAYVLW